MVLGKLTLRAILFEGDTPQLIKDTHSDEPAKKSSHKLVIGKQHTNYI